MLCFLNNNVELQLSRVSSVYKESVEWEEGDDHAAADSSRPPFDIVVVVVATAARQSAITTEGARAAFGGPFGVSAPRSQWEGSRGLVDAEPQPSSARLARRSDKAGLHHGLHHEFGGGLRLYSLGRARLGLVRTYSFLLYKRNRATVSSSSPSATIPRHFHLELTWQK
jgi:hypothetical protein